MCALSTLSHSPNGDIYIQISYSKMFIVVRPSELKEILSTCSKKFYESNNIIVDKVHSVLVAQDSLSCYMSLFNEQFSVGFSHKDILDMSIISGVYDITASRWAINHNIKFVEPYLTHMLLSLRLSV